MKISKKILTFVAPIATVATIVPIATSCGGESFSFSYGDSINCLKEYKDGDFKDVTLHSLDVVKSTAKTNSNRWTKDTVSTTELSTFADIPSNYKEIYYDVVASLAINNNVKFALKWTYSTTDNKLAIKYDDGTTTLDISGAALTYEYVTTAPAAIKIKIKDGETEKLVANSYVFSGVTVKD